MSQQNELIIRIGGRAEDISAASFIRVLRSTLNALRSMEGSRGRWYVTRITKNSPAMCAMRPELTMDSTAVEFVRGVRQLEREPKAPHRFTDNTMLNAQRALAPLNNGVAFVEYAAGDEHIRPTQHLVANVDVATGRIGRTHYERTTIRGTLETLTVKSDSQVFFVRDRLRGRNVRCGLKPEDLGAAKDALGLRVSVTGIAKYNRENDIVGIDVESFRVIPTMPTPLGEMPALNLTNGVNPVEFVRRLRRAD